MDGETNLSDLFQEPEFFDTTNFSSSPQDDLFSVLQAWENSASDYTNPVKTLEKNEFEFQKSYLLHDQSDQRKCRKTQKLNLTPTATASATSTMEEGQHRMSHITVERNRRKQMNEHLSVLRSLMPCFYVKRGDQASIIGGVVDYIHELQQILQSLEAKKQRKVYSEVISPRPVSSPLSPRKPPLSLPISPSTPQPSSPYKPWMQHHPPPGYHLSSPTIPSQAELQLPSPCNSSTNSSINDAVNELVATSKSAVAEVEVKFSGPNLVLKTVSHRIPGQAVKIVSALEELALEILQVKMSTVDETMLNFFTIKIGIECQLSAEELAHQIQQTFC